MTDDAKTDRRGVLKTLGVLGGALGCGALAVPTARFLVDPARGGSTQGRWIPTVRIDALVEGEPKRVALVADHRDAWVLEKDVALGAAWLVRELGAVRAWSVTCPHLGCAIDRPASGGGFSCPCHDSSFDGDGRRLTGPSPRALDALETRIEDGVVLVNFRRFRQGTAEKIQVG